jgi:hypothetical protein
VVGEQRARNVGERKARLGLGEPGDLQCRRLYCDRARCFGPADTKIGIDPGRLDTGRKQRPPAAATIAATKPITIFTIEVNSGLRRGVLPYSRSNRRDREVPTRRQ